MMQLCAISIVIFATLVIVKILFPGWIKKYPLSCTNFKLAESRREDCELCISTSSNRIPDNVLTVQLLVYCYKRVRKNTE